jgi:DNA-binding response OmpR family regulator
MKILIIEDDPDIIDSIGIALKMRWPEGLLISSRLGEKGLQMVEEESPDIVVLDLGLPDVNGFEILKGIRLFSQVPIIILSVRGDEIDIVKGLEWGADDYISKPFKQMEFIARIKSLLRRNKVHNIEAPCNRGYYRISTVSRKAYFKDKSITLTGTECIIFCKLLNNANDIVTYQSLSTALWGEEYPGSTEAIYVHVARLRNKLETGFEQHGIISNKAKIGYIFNLSE